jgi:small subunit ribosomal protein S1
MKQLTDDPWEKFSKELLTGTPAQGKVVRVVNFGLFVELENGLEGLVHISEIPGMTASDLEKNFTIGQNISVSILNVDHDARRIALTCKGEVLSSSDSH